MEQVEVAGLTIGFRRAGTGPALVLVHGGLCDSRVWRDQLEGLSDEYSVIAWDAPGCGGSADPPEHFDLADYADCLAAFIEVLELDRPHVLGHSFGGGLVLQLGARHPRLPRSLVVVGGYAEWRDSLPPEEVEARLELALRQSDELPKPVDPRSIPGLLSPAMSPERVEEVAAIMFEVRPTGTRVMARAFAAADLRGVLGRIQAPTLVLHGSEDERAGGTVAEALHAAIPTSTLSVLLGVGHECYLESPEAFNREVRSFLRSVG